MRAEQRLYRTADGQLVREGHVDAAFLAYLPGDEVGAKDEAQLKPRQPVKKAAAKPADKSMPKPDDK